MTLIRRGPGGGEEPPPQRSDEERERARAEREARRAAREGRGPQPTGDVPAPIPDPPPEPEPAENPSPATPDVYPPVTPDRLSHLPGEDLAAAPDDPAPVATAATMSQEPVIPATEPPDEPAVGPRTARREEAGGILAGATARKPPRRRKRRWIGLALLVVLVGALAWFAISLWQPFHGSGHGRVVVEIPPNSSSRKIGNILEHNGAVASGFFFALRARLSGKSGKMRPGRYVMQQDMSYSAAINVLTTPPKAAKVVNVSLPEGLSIREAGPLVKSAGLKGSYLDDTARSSELQPKYYGAPHGTHSLEGFLFPATYQIKAGASVKSLIHKQIVAFRRNLKQVDMSYARSKHLTAYDVLTIASMVERESASPGDRKKIAAVIYNRLHDHMPLGVDATLRFALHDWDKPLTVSQLRTDTPYNTRVHLGLPPTPIGSPGLAAMQAAAHPAHVGYLYYVANPDGCGGTVFSSTDAKFERDARRYRAAVAANHGHVPSCKHKK